MDNFIFRVLVIAGLVVLFGSIVEDDDSLAIKGYVMVIVGYVININNKIDKGDNNE